MKRGLIAGVIIMLMIPGIIAATMVISQDTSGNKFVDQGNSLIITNGANLSGNVFVRGGTLIIEDNSIVTGDVFNKNLGVINIKNSFITGDVSALTNKTRSVSIENSRIGGEINLLNGTLIELRGNKINDGITIMNFDRAIAVNNNVTGILFFTDGNTVLSSNNNGTVGTTVARVKNDVGIFRNNLLKRIFVLDSGSVSIGENNLGGEIISRRNLLANIYSNSIGTNISSRNDSYVYITENTVPTDLIITNPIIECFEFSNAVSGTNTGCP